MAHFAGFKQVNEIEAASLMGSLETIAYYVSRYGGGQGQALILFLNQFSALHSICQHFYNYCVFSFCI